MTTIYCEKLNEATLRVYSDDFGIEQELSEHFTFFVPGYKFMPLYRNKVWDGKARLYDIHRKTISSGLYEYVYKFAKDNGYSLNTAEGVYPSQEKITREEVVKFAESLNLHTRGQKLELRDYQIDAIYQAINRERILALSPTSSGKSAIIYVYLRWHLAHKKKIILMVPTTMLVNQMFSDFKDYSSEDAWNADEHCHILYSGKEKTFEKSVLITTWQSVHALTKRQSAAANKFFAQWQVYIGDEAHLFASNSLQQITKSLVNARYRLGTTGTIQDEKVAKLSLEGSFGPVYKVTTTRKLMDANQVTNLKIKCITLKHTQEECKLLKGADYQKEIDFLVTHEKRNQFITKLAKVTKGTTLVLFQFVEKHGKGLYQLIKEKCPDRQVFFISGIVSADERERIRKAIDTIEDAVIVASYKTLSTGVNIPKIENVIFASPVKSKITNLQSIGRGLRLREGKSSCLLFDISDDLMVKSKPNHTLNHLRSRIEQYTNEEFDFELINVTL